MKIISFAWTTPALIARRKTVTRRDWNSDYARTFRNGDFVQAWNRSPRFRGEQVGVIQLTEAPYLEQSGDMPDADYEGEGFAYFDEHPDLLPKGRGSVLTAGESMLDSFNLWKASDEPLWVIRFKVVLLARDGRTSLQGAGHDR